MLISGLTLTTFLATPELCITSTTWSTALYAPGASSEIPLRLWPLIIIPLSASFLMTSVPLYCLVAWFLLITLPAPWIALPNVSCIPFSVPCKIKEYVPIANNLTKDDFRCIFCYELPNKNKDTVVICPNCRKPAHQNEYRQWANTSRICSYCNKDIKGTPKQISGKKYSQVVKLALKGS